MTKSDQGLVTPIHVKTRADSPWPEQERVFYQLTSSGLYLCRNHEFFCSSVPAPSWPSELAPQRSFLRLRYPKMPRRLLELAVGFFARIGELHGSEAGLLIAWDRETRRVRLFVPPQIATVGRGWLGEVYPIGLHYEMPADLPHGWTIIGDMHSHVHGQAYSSATDRDDEAYGAGLHIVVGRIGREPPQFHVELVVDGARFEVDSAHVFEGYEKRRLDVPEKWLDMVTVGSAESSRQHRQYSDAYVSTRQHAAPNVATPATSDKEQRHEP